MAKFLSPVILAAAIATAAPIQMVIADSSSTTADQSTSGSELGEIVVTAQRRNQTLETTPVAISVLNADALQQQQIISEEDLQFAVPGLMVKASQSENQLNFSMRGQTVDAFTSSRPAVLPYFNEVQVGSQDSSSFYDLESVQVLKGPQGTLFGRNATGGAVLFTSAKPTDEWGGYVTVRGGNYSDIEAEGAVNMPIIPETVLLRIAGFYQTRDGYQFNLYNNTTDGNVDRKNVRASLTVKPASHITNDLVLDYAQSGGNNLSSVVYNTVPIGSGAPYVPANVLYSPSLDSVFGPGAWNKFLAANPGAYPGGLYAYGLLQSSRGPFLIDVNSPSNHYGENQILTNATTLELNANARIKNIIGYTDIRQTDQGEFDGTPYPIDSNGLAGGLGRSTVLHQFSDELQLSGETFAKRLDYVTGLFYSDEKLHQDSLSVIAGLEPFAPATNQVNNGVLKNTTYAGYAHGTLDISDLVNVPGLAVQAGGRYTDEEVNFRHLPGDVYLSEPVPPGAVFDPFLSDAFKKFSWQVGINEQLNPNTLLYVVSRRSFRSGGFNFYAPPLAGNGNQGGSEYLPETATDVEIGAKFKGNIGVVPARLDIALYDMQIQNVQRVNYVSIFGSLAGITVNVPRAVVKGVELDAVIKPTSWLDVGSTLNATDARFTESTVSVLQNPTTNFGPYPDTPKWSGSVFAEVSEPVSPGVRGSVRAEWYSQSSFFFSSTDNTLNPGTEAPGYSILNVHAGLDAATGWEVGINIKNALNKVYYVGGIGYASLLAVNTVIPGAPRTLVVEARYKF